MGDQTNVLAQNVQSLLDGQLNAVLNDTIDVEFEEQDAGKP